MGVDGVFESCCWSLSEDAPRVSRESDQIELSKKPPLEISYQFVCVLGA